MALGIHCFLLSIVRYLFLNPVQKLIAKLNAEFSSKNSPHPYPQTLIIDILIFTINKRKN